VNLTGRSSISIIDRTEAQGMHEAALSVLADTGLKVNSASAQKLLEDHGCQVAKETHIVKIPEHLVEEAIRSAPKEFVLASRDFTRDIQIPAAETPAICTDGFAIEVWDIESGSRRRSTTEDLAGFARLGDVMDALDFFWPTLTPQDVPPPAQLFRAFVTSLENTGKHIQHEALGSKMARAQIRAATEILGDEKVLKKRPIFSAVQCPIAPLQFETDSIEAAMEFAKAGIPVVFMSMPMAGGSAPITMAGSIVQGHAEVLGGLTISQLCEKGAPVFHCILTGPMDMQTGAWASGSPENAIGNAAAVQLAKHLGLPSMGGGFGTTAKVPGLQAGYEKIATMIPSALAGADIITGIGGLDDARVMSLEEAVIDIEMWTYVMRMLRGIDTRPESLGVDVIRDVGPGGMFLGRKDTMTKFRSELWMPSLGQRQNYEQWKREGSTDILRRAAKRASDLSSRPVRNPLQGDVRARLETMVKAEIKAAA